MGLAQCGFMAKAGVIVPVAFSSRGFFVGVLRPGELQRALADVFEVTFLDRQRPAHELVELALPGVLVERPEDRPVPNLAASAMTRNSKPSSPSESPPR
jgi:hypothetical protein